jgi:hypothetical protein
MIFTVITATLFGIFNGVTISQPYGTNQYYFTTTGTAMWGDAGGGTLANPFNGSTQQAFDANLTNMPPNVEINLGAGTYSTMGTKLVQARQYIHGAGIGSTILRFPASAVSSNLVSSFFTTDGNLRNGITISDMTLDGNWQTGTITTLNGVALWGSSNTLSRLALINTGSATTYATNYVESFGLFLWGSNSYNNTIRDCVVSNYTQVFNNNQSAMGIAQTTHGQIYNNKIYQTTTNAVLAIGYIGTDATITNNWIEGCVNGFHADTPGAVTNLLLTGNVFTNCARAGFTGNTTNLHWTVTNNVAVLSYTNYPVSFFYFANPCSNYDLNISYNTTTVTTNNGVVQSKVFIWMDNGVNVNILTNTYTGLTNYIAPACVNVTILP